MFNLRLYLTESERAEIETLTPSDQDKAIAIYNRCILGHKLCPERGDIITSLGRTVENQDLYLWDGQSVIGLDYSNNIFGDIPSSFRILESPDFFPPDKWSEFFCSRVFFRISPHLSQILERLEESKCGDSRHNFVSTFEVEGKLYWMYLEEYDHTLEEIKNNLSKQEYLWVSPDFEHGEITIVEDFTDENAEEDYDY
jgi:hypothetical protein